MVARRIHTLAGFALVLGSLAAAATGCEPSFLGDYSNRSNGSGAANGQNSSGGTGWNSSPRWNASNPQSQQNPTQNAQSASPPSGGNAGVVQQGNGAQQPAPWTGGPTNNGAAANNGPLPGNGTVVSGPVNPPQSNPASAVCEDSRPRALDMPGESCARPCRAAWQRCFDGCNNGQERACVAACDDTFRECMRGCY